MNTRSVFRRLLAMVMALAVCLSILPWTALAAEGDTYTQVTSLSEITAGGEFVLVAQNESSYVALSTAIKGKPDAVAVTVSGGTVTGSALPVWTIAPIAGGGVSLSNGSAYLKYSSSTNLASDTAAYDWTVTDQGGTFRFVATATASASTVRGIGYQISGNRFGGYAVSNAGNGYVFDLLVFKKADATVTPEPTEAPTEESTQAPTEESTEAPTEAPTEPEVTGVVWNKVNLADIGSGDTIAITMTAANGTSYALTSAGGTSSAPTAMVVTVSGSTMTSDTADAISWNIAQENGSLVIYVAGSTGAWLYSTNTNNGVRVGTNANKTWVVDAAAGILKHEGTGRYMGVYTANPDWRAYTSVNSNITGQTLDFWRLGAGSGTVDPTEPSTEPSEPVTEPSEPATEPSEPTTEPTEPVTEGIADGDYVIWVPAYNLALSSVKTGYSNYYNAGVAVKETDGTLTGYGTTEVWTVTNQPDGSITISQSGQNLGMADSYTSLDLGAVNDKWTLTQNADGTWNVVNAVRGNTLAYSSYGNWEASAEITEAGRAAVKFTPAGEVTEQPESPALESGSYVIWVPAYNVALSAEKSGYYNAGVAVTLTGDILSGYGKTEIWTVTVSEDGKSCTISQNGQNLGMAAENSSMDLGAVNDVWEIEPLTGGLYNLKNQARGTYMEWYAAKNNWSTYNSSYAATDGQFQLMLTPAEIPTEVDPSVVEDIAQWSGGYTEAAAAKLYADGDKYVDGDKLDTEAVLTVRANGSIISPYYLPGANGYMGGNNVGKAAGDYIQLAFSTAGWGDMTLAFRLRATNAGPGSFQLCYSTDGGSTWENFTTGAYAYSYTQYTSTGSYPVNKTGSISDGVAMTSMAPGNYISFSFDVPKGAEDCKNLLIRMIPSNNYQADGDTAAVAGNIRIDTVVVSGSPIIGEGRTAYVDVTPNGEIDQPTGTALTMTCATEGAVIHYRVNGGDWQVYDPENKPTLDTLPCNLEVKASSEGNTDSVVLLYQYKAGTVQSVQFDPNGGGVYIAEGSTETITLSCSTSGATIYYATSPNGETYGEYKVYSAPIELQKGFGQLYVKAYATKAGFNDSIEVVRTFTERQNAGYTLYFGQLHSHTSISDGSGTVEQAFKHAYDVANLDFLAVTDHSNYFDNHLSGALGSDGTTVSSEWAEGQAMAEKYTDATFVGLYGFEMTWSGGSPGHINTFNTPGWQSRNQSQYSTKTATDLLNYYDTLASVPQSISQFNHPGTTFGDFYDFGYHSESADNMVTLIEVGNGEGAIGSSGYFPSYEYYTRALDKGWHVAPTNNQDNHRGNWGDSNTGRTVVLADVLTAEGIYDALRNRRVYATEDNDLSILYTMNGALMGSILSGSDVGATAEITVTISDPTDNAIGKVEVIVDGGLSAASQQVTTSSETVTFQLDHNYSYYYIKITQPDGDIAVTAPVWAGEADDAGIISFEAEPVQANLGQEQSFKLEIYNNEASALAISSIVYTNKATGDVLFTDSTITSVVSGGTGISQFKHTFTTDGVYTVTATVTGTLNGNTVTYTKDVEVIVMPEEVVTPIADVRASAAKELGKIFTIEGYVTAGTTNVATTFFDTIYVQDATGGIAVFPYGETGLALGTKVRITGYTDAYQGDLELQIISMTVLEDSKQVIEPAAVSCKDAMDYAANGGELLKVQGEVVDVIPATDGVGVSQFTVKDENGDTATVFINGYIFSGTTGKNTLTDIVKVGNTVSAIGLGYMMPNGSARSSITVLRVRDCDEVVLISEPQQPTEPSEPETEPTDPSTEPSEPETEPSEPETEPTDPSTEPTEPEAPEGVVWKKIALEDIKPGDTVTVTMTASDGTTYVLSTVMTKKGPSAPTGTVSGDELILSEEVSASAGWNIVATDGGYYIQTPDGAYLYTTNSNSGTKTGSTKAVWAVVDGYLSTADTAGNTRYLGVYTGAPDWRSYKAVAPNLSGQTLNFWILEETDVPVEPTEPSEPETEPTEPSTEPSEPETEPTEPSTEPTEPSTEPTEPSTEPTEPSTEPTEPSTEPTEPSTEPSEPETEPSEPSTEPSEPETEPTQPETEPTQPSTEATGPSTEATEPSTEATQPTKPSDGTNVPTGDTSGVLIVLVVMVAALIGLAVLLVLRRKLVRDAEDEA